MDGRRNPKWDGAEAFPPIMQVPPLAESFFFRARTIADTARFVLPGSGWKAMDMLLVSSLASKRKGVDCSGWRWMLSLLLSHRSFVAQRILQETTLTPLGQTPPFRYGCQVTPPLNCGT